MDSPALNSISLCAGVGMLDIGIELGLEYLGYRVRPVAYVEREAYACAILGDRGEAEALGDAPLYPNLVEFDGRPFRGLVDIIHGGFPCQPWSAAGQKKGTADERWIWPDIVRVVAEVEPAFCFFENVRGLVSGGGLERCLFDLARIGFDAEWTVIAASDVGASHKRERIFILAVHQSRGCGILRQSSGGYGFADRGDARMEALGHTGHHAGNAEYREQPKGSTGRIGEPSENCVESMANTSYGLIPQPWRGSCERDGAGSAVAVLDDTSSARRDGARIGSSSVIGGGECVSRAGCADVGDANAGRLQQCESKNGRDAEPVSGCVLVANPSGEGPQGGEQRGARNTDRGGAGSTWTN